MCRFPDEIIWLPKSFEFLAGLPERKRRGRRIVTMQAFIDDSGTKGTGKILILAGLFGTAEALASVADNWDRELRSRVPLPIRYFKADEANGLDGEFRDWSRKSRDQKVRRLAAVIDREDLVMILSAVDLRAHKQLESEVGEPALDAKKHPYNHPYLMALLIAAMAVGMEMWHRKLQERVEIIFDDHPTFRDIAKAQYETLKEVVPDWLRGYLPVEPYFRDDKDWVVLQASDLLAGNGRMVVEKVSRWPSITWEKLLVSPFSKHYWAAPLAQLSVKELARRYRVPEDFFKVTLAPPPSDAGAS